MLILNVLHISVLNSRYSDAIRTQNLYSIVINYPVWKATNQVRLLSSFLTIVSRWLIIVDVSCMFHVVVLFYMSDDYSDAERCKRQKLEEEPWNICKAFHSSVCSFFFTSGTSTNVSRKETVFALYEKRRWIHGTVEFSSIH